MDNVSVNVIENIYIRVRIKALEEGLEVEALDLFFEEYEIELEYML